MTDLVEICIEKPLEGIKTKQGKLKDRATNIIMDTMLLSWE